MLSSCHMFSRSNLRFLPPAKSSTRPSYLCIATLLGSYGLLIPGPLPKTKVQSTAEHQIILKVPCCIDLEDSLALSSSSSWALKSLGSRWSWHRWNEILTGIIRPSQFYTSLRFHFFDLLAWGRSWIHGNHRVNSGVGASSLQDWWLDRSFAATQINQSYNGRASRSQKFETSHSGYRKASPCILFRTGQSCVFHVVLSC